MSLKVCLTEIYRCRSIPREFPDEPAICRNPAHDDRAEKKQDTGTDRPEDDKAGNIRDDDREKPGDFPAPVRSVHGYDKENCGQDNEQETKHRVGVHRIDSVLYRSEDYFFRIDTDRSPESRKKSQANDGLPDIILRFPAHREIRFNAAGHGLPENFHCIAARFWYNYV